MADQPGPIEGELTEARDLCIFADPEQLELLAAEQLKRDAGAAVRELERRGRGRPKGSLNKRNAKFRDQVLAMGGHPAQALIRLYSTPIDQLTAQLQCSRIEAAQLAVKAAAELLPYMEGKQPVQVELRQRNDVVLILPGSGGMTDAQLEQIRDDVQELDAIDWHSAELEDLPASFSGEPGQDVLPSSAD